MAADYSRIHRLLKILTLIQGEKGWTATKLAKECGKTARTIYRDMDMLEGAGIPYFFDPEAKCYQIRRDFFMKPVELTLDETLAIVALGEHVGGAEQIPMTKSAAKAVAKIRTQLPETIRKELENLDPHLKISLARSAPADGIGDVYAKVRHAITRKRALSCRYDSISKSKEVNGNGEFMFRPYSLLFNQRAWYAIGFHDGRGEIRCLKLNRFSAMKVTDRPYAIPDDFTVESHLGHAWRMIRGKKRHEVELRFDADFAETISDTHWHATQEIDGHADGSITFRCTVDGLDEIVWWILSMGPHCVVVQPKELADRVKELAAEVVKKYTT